MQELLEIAITARLEALRQGTPYRNSAPRDTSPPYFVYRVIEGDNGMRTRNGSTTDGLVGTDCRYYVFIAAAVARDPDVASAMRQGAEAALDGWRPTIEGWTATLPVFWNGLESDPGALLPGGVISYEAGDRYTANFYRPR